MPKGIKKVAKETLEKSRGFALKGKESGLWRLKMSVSKRGPCVKMRKIGKSIRWLGKRLKRQ